MGSHDGGASAPRRGECRWAVRRAVELRFLESRKAVNQLRHRQVRQRATGLGRHFRLLDFETLQPAVPRRTQRSTRPPRQHRPAVPRGTCVPPPTPKQRPYEVARCPTLADPVPRGTQSSTRPPHQDCPAVPRGTDRPPKTGAPVRFAIDRASNRNSCRTRSVTSPLAADLFRSNHLLALRSAWYQPEAQRSGEGGQRPSPGGRGSGG